MKTTGLILCLAFAAVSAASAAELLWDDFDAAPTGSVANLPGWTRADWLGTTTGNIVSAGAYFSPSNTIELPWNANGSAAVYTNFSATYGTAQHPVVRFSAKLETGNTNIFFRIGLRNSGTGSTLSLQGSNGYASLGFQYHDGAFVPLVLSRFADATFFYNRSNGQYRLDYNTTNILPWSDSDVYPFVQTQFNQFVAMRLLNTAQTTGRLFIDDVSVETFPPHVWAWWRCTAESYGHFVEQVGAFKPTLRVGYADSVRAGSADTVWDGTGDFRNAGATRQLVAGPGDAARALPAVTNWTLEAVVRMDPAAGNTALFDWGTDLGFNATGAWIQIGYSTNGYVFANLRDTQQGDVTYATVAFRYFVPNGRWQHLALVKSNAAVALYVDYQLVTNRILVGTADGAYAFPVAAHAAIGRTLNGGNTSEANTRFDEVRFSTKNLALSEFLQPGPPLIVAATNSALPNPWELTMKGILGKTYHVETSASCGADAAWQPVPGSAFVANYTFNFVDVSSLPRTNFVRLVRED